MRAKGKAGKENSLTKRAPAFTESGKAVLAVDGRGCELPRPFGYQKTAITNLFCQVKFKFASLSSSSANMKLRLIFPMRAGRASSSGRKSA